MAAPNAAPAPTPASPVVALLCANVPTTPTFEIKIITTVRQTMASLFAGIEHLKKEVRKMLGARYWDDICSLCFNSCQVILEYRDLRIQSRKLNGSLILEQQDRQEWRVKIPATHQGQRDVCPTERRRNRTVDALAA